MGQGQREKGFIENRQKQGSTQQSGGSSKTCCGGQGQMGEGEGGGEEDVVRLMTPRTLPFKAGV